MFLLALAMFASTPALAAEASCPEKPAAAAVHLSQGRLDPDVAARCLRAAVDGPDGAQVVATILKRVPAMSRAPTRLEAIGPALDAWLPSHSVDAKVSKRARNVFRRLGPAWAGRLELLDADAGLLDGNRVTAALLADPAVGMDSLERLARRLPDPNLRVAAGEQLVDRRIAALDLGGLEPLARAAAIEHGRFALAADRFEVRGLAFTESARTGPWWVEQRVFDDVFVVVPPSGGRTPELDEVVRVEVDGLPAPVGVCVDGEVFDPTPCIAPARVTVAGLFERSGSRISPVQIPASGLIDALDTGGLIGVSIGDVRADMRVELAPMAVDPVVIQGPPDSPGPDLEVRVSQPGDWILVEISAPDAAYRVLVDPAEPGPFELVSMGGGGLAGADGQDGRNGIAGNAGRNAMCPYNQAEPGQVGGDGEPGQPGANGARGGPGGEIRVLVTCRDDEQCAGLREFALERIDARGGPGGPGGAGGAGGSPGRGGRGGRGATCQTGRQGSVIWPDAQDGPEGLVGSRGPEGAQGRQGPAGNVIITLGAPVDSP